MIDEAIEKVREAGGRMLAEPVAREWGGRADSGRPWTTRADEVTTVERASPMGRWADQENDDGRDDRATERDHRGSEPTAQPGIVGPRPYPLGLRRQGRHTPQCPDRVRLERRGDRHVHDEERPEAPGPTQEPDGCPDDRHRGAPAQDLAHPRSGRAGRRRWHPG